MAASTVAQTNIGWFKVSGGGGTSTGGVYSVSGTIGQHDAGGVMTGSNFFITGGFWATYAVQTSDAPLLTVKQVAPGMLSISWSPTTPRFVLQQNYDLASTNWINSPSGATNPIAVTPTQPARYYRLFRP